MKFFNFETQVLFMVNFTSALASDVLLLFALNSAGLQILGKLLVRQILGLEIIPILSSLLLDGCVASRSRCSSWNVKNRRPSLQIFALVMILYGIKLLIISSSFQNFEGIILGDQRGVEILILLNISQVVLLIIILRKVLGDSIIFIFNK